MKTIITEEINAKSGPISIIKGFDSPVIDAFFTKKAVGESIKKTTEFTAVVELLHSINARGKMAGQSLTSMFEAKKRGNEKDRLRYEGDLRQHRLVLEELQIDLKPLQENLKKKEKEQIKTNSVYFESKKGEFQISDEKAEELSVKYAARVDHQELTQAGKLIADYRGVEYWVSETIKDPVSDEIVGVKWSVAKIMFIDESIPDGGIETKDLTQTDQAEIQVQAQIERIEKLTDAERQAEYDNSVLGAAGQSAVDRSVFEIQGDSAEVALTKAQGLYQTKVDALAVKYGVTA